MGMTKSDLTQPRQRLIELMQEINHGRIERFEVRNGEPVFDPPPTVLRLFLFGKDNGPNASRSSEDFVLKKNVAEMFEIFDREQSLWIEELVVADGLPVRMCVRKTVRA